MVSLFPTHMVLTTKITGMDAKPTLYRERAEYVEAIQLNTEQDAHAIYNWIIDNKGWALCPTEPELHVLFDSPAGRQRADKGDWVTRTVNGFYPCKDDVFFQVFERVSYFSQPVVPPLPYNPVQVAPNTNWPMWQQPPYTFTCAPAATASQNLTVFGPLNPIEQALEVADGNRDPRSFDYVVGGMDFSQPPTFGTRQDEVTGEG